MSLISLPLLEWVEPDKLLDCVTIMQGTLTITLHKQKRGILEYITAVLSILYTAVLSILEYPVLSILEYTVYFLRLQDLVVGKLLIAAVVPVARQDKEKISTHFPVLHHLQNINYPMYYADLANGNKEWLTDTLVQEELGNPDANSFLREEGVSWIIVRGTHVAGPTSIWLQYSIDRTSQSVMNMFQCLQILVSSKITFIRHCSSYRLLLLSHLLSLIL